MDNSKNKIHAAVVQMQLQTELSDSIHATDVLLGQAQNKPDLIMLPEVAWMSWLGGAGQAEDDTAMQQKVLAAVQDLARRHKAAVVLSLRLGRSNRWLWIDSAGEQLMSYDKIHLFSPYGEGRRYDAGSTVAAGRMPVGDQQWMVGAAVCYDLRFPEQFRKLRTYGSELIIVPSRWPKPRLTHWSLLLAARAVENQCWVIGVNACGVDPAKEALVYGGASCIIAPDGQVVASASDQPVLLEADLDRAQVLQLRESFPVWNDRTLI